MNKDFGFRKCVQTEPSYMIVAIQVEQKAKPQLSVILRLVWIVVLQYASISNKLMITCPERAKLSVGIVFQLVEKMKYFWPCTKSIKSQCTYNAASRGLWCPHCVACVCDSKGKNKKHHLPREQVLRWHLKIPPPPRIMPFERRSHPSY